jgi:hypothetical protein
MPVAVCGPVVKRASHLSTLRLLLVVVLRLAQLSELLSTPLCNLAWYLLQVATLRAFEDKCKRLYDVRLTEYAEKTAQQMGQYEEQLLQVRCRTLYVWLLLPVVLDRDLLYNVAKPRGSDVRQACNLLVSVPQHFCLQCLLRHLYAGWFGAGGREGAVRVPAETHQAGVQPLEGRVPEGRA